ncbi:MAG: quercetin dioxygenase-like cupin family protein [Granulosicoccus sp.]|jgi:quercetin dioxygenase-like cupin family protein
MVDGQQDDTFNHYVFGACDLSTSLLSSRLVRYADLKPCLNAFVDTRTPGSDTKENFTIVGPGVSENPDQHVHLPEPHGFNIGGARQPPGCLNSQHSHNTAEVFVVHSGQWRFLYGVNADDAYVDLSPGDTISIPTKMFRGFENTGDATGFLFAVLGGDDPGKVTWAPSVFDLAEQYGLILLEGGRLVDVAAGDEVPEGAKRQQAPNDAEVAALKTPSADELTGCVALGSSLQANDESSLMAVATGATVAEAAVITPIDTPDGFHAGPIKGWWGHGFNLRRITLEPASALAAHTRQEAEVVFLHSGELTIAIVDGEEVSMGPGDTLSLPIGMVRTWANTSNETAIAFVVRGGELPQAPVVA